ncbi:hypothetical protein BC829DRAFT_116018 [Chytridium lagenaria]|nr:hypothetical protein BC829DRAFT_116018 [Chytridium lagenaria]
MASVLIGLTALAVYRYIQKRRNSRSPEMLLINKCFPKELQLQIINDFDECVATFTASRYDKHQKTILLLKQQQLLNEENTETSNVSLDDDDPPKKSRFSFFMSRKKPGTTTSGSTSPARRSSNASTSSELAPFDPTVVRLEACTSLLILGRWWMHSRKE